jgi:peroxiredoxin
MKPSLRHFPFLMTIALILQFTSASIDAEETNAKSSNKISFNKVLKIGDAAPAWKDLPGVDDKKHSLDDFKSAEVVVVVFTCNSCPYATDYEERTKSFAKSQCMSADKTKPSKVQLVAINVNKVPEDSFEKMKARAKEHEFNFPYLFDESQEIAKKFGAITTPQFFVLDQDRKLVYTGAMDDNSDATKAKKNFVIEATEAILARKTVATTSEPPRGCLIRFAKERRK